MCTRNRGSTNDVSKHRSHTIGECGRLSKLRQVQSAKAICSNVPVKQRKSRGGAFLLALSVRRNVPNKNVSAKQNGLAGRLNAECSQEQLHLVHSAVKYVCKYPTRWQDAPAPNGAQNCYARSSTLSFLTTFAAASIRSMSSRACELEW